MRKSHGRISKGPEGEARRFEGPSVRGFCEIEEAVGPCLNGGRIRYFVAVKLPRPTVMCDDHYLWLRSILEDRLKEIMEGLLPREAEDYGA